MEFMSRWTRSQVREPRVQYNAGRPEVAESEVGGRISHLRLGMAREGSTTVEACAGARRVEACAGASRTRRPECLACSGAGFPPLLLMLARLWPLSTVRRGPKDTPFGVTRRGVGNMPEP